MTSVTESSSLQMVVPRYPKRKRPAVSYVEVEDDILDDMDADDTYGDTSGRRKVCIFGRLLGSIIR
jgi:hypothetical protein